MDALLRGYRGGWGLTPFLVFAQRRVKYVLIGPDTTKVTDTTENKLALHWSEAQLCLPYVHLEKEK